MLENIFNDMEKKDRTKEIQSFVKLLDIMDELREKCPWDRKQTIDSMRPMTIEETFELSDAIIRGDMKNISKELGDVLLHIVFYSKIASETGQFDICDVMDQLCNKLVYRHPHVFGEKQVKDAEEVVKNWEQLKRTEKDGNKTVLSGVPDSMPSTIKALRMQEKASAVGFDWSKKEEVWDKVSEEIAEFHVELKKDLGKKENKALAEGELGDLMFSVINAARLYDLDPDTALEMTNKKFRNRFGYVEAKAKERGIALKGMSLQEMDALWNEAKESGL